VNLFLDDERFPKDVKWIELPAVEWKIIRTFNEFVQFIEQNGPPAIISFDHDLAWPEHYEEYVKCRRLDRQFEYENMKERTGFCAAKWLCEYCQDNKIKFPEYYVHTMNPIGKENIISYIESYKRVVENERD